MEVKTALVLFFLHGVAISVVLAKPGRPTIQQWPAKVHAGDTVTLTCFVHPDDYPCPTSYRWYKGYSRNSAKNEHNQTFTIKTVSSGDDSSYYRCTTIIRGEGQSDKSSRKWLTVIDKPLVSPFTPPDSPMMIWFPSSGQINAGDILNIVCIADDPTRGKPFSFEIWCKREGFFKFTNCTKGFKKEDIGQVQVVTFSKSVKLSDAGQYFCRAVFSPCGEDDSPSIKLYVKDPPSPKPIITFESKASLNVGDTLKLTCKTQTYTGIQFKWYKDDDLIAEEKDYTKDRVDSEDAGSYICQIKPSSDYDEVNSTALIISIISEIAASFRSTKTFTKKLLDETTQEYKDMKENFEPLLQNAFRSKVASGQMKGVIITGFEEGSVIVHYKIILKVSVSITDNAMNPAIVSKMFVDYLKDNPNEAKKYAIAPGSAGTVDVISAITATLIVILIVTVVVLVVFLIRLKRQVMEKQFAGDGVEYTAGVNGHRPPGVKVKKSNGLDADNVYAAIGEKESVSDLYRNLGQQKRIAKPKASRENPAFETKEGDYLDIVGDGGVVSPNMLASLEDGYQGNDPVYHVLESDAAVASKKPDMAGYDADYSLAGDAQWTNVGPNAAAAPTEESVYSLAQDSAAVDDDYATPDRDDYAVLNKKKVDGAKGTKPGWVGLKTKPKTPVQKPQTGKITKGDA